MAFTGELEQLHIVDIIQLLNTTRKSGTFTVKSSRGESRIIFSNGYIVGASHLNNRIRIGTVLVKMKVITPNDLTEALDIQKKAGNKRKPLLTTLIESGKLSREAATKGLKKLIEITLVELIGWKKGTFTLDTEAIEVSPECSYSVSEMDQHISLDAQMLLMDALRLFDEHERDRQAGKEVPAQEEIYVDIVKPEQTSSVEKAPAITADILGLADLESLERKMPVAAPEDEAFNPLDMHRQKINETLKGFSEEEQEFFVAFLEKSSSSMSQTERSQRNEGRARGLILFSEDELIRHSVMTICKAENVLVFSTDEEEELGRIIEQCIRRNVQPIVAFDSPGSSGKLISREKIVELQKRMKEKYPHVAIIQMAPLPDYAFLMQSYIDGIRAVFPRPMKESWGTTFIADTIEFLDTFKAYIRGFFDEQKDTASPDSALEELKDRLAALWQATDPAGILLAMLNDISFKCDRCITFLVRGEELVGDKSIGVYAEKSSGPTSVTRLKLPLNVPSIFSVVTLSGQPFIGEARGEVVENHLFDAIGAPLENTVVLIPVKSRGRVVALTYGDFGEKDVTPVQMDTLEILASTASALFDNALYRKQMSKSTGV